MIYDVHLFPTVRVRVVGVEASNVAEAVSKAQDLVNLHALFDEVESLPVAVKSVSWTEDPIGLVAVDMVDKATGEALRDEVWTDGDGNALKEGKSLAETKADAFDAAQVFMQELLMSVESLGGIAEAHGTRTLTDLMYLQSAILSGEHIDLWPDESDVLKVVSALPSWERWTKFIKIPGKTPLLPLALSFIKTAQQLNEDNEIVVRLADGWSLRSSSESLEAGDYVRLCQPDGTEYAYWSHDEWRDDPIVVMGAIMNAAAGVRPLQVLETTE